MARYPENRQIALHVVANLSVAKFLLEHDRQGVGTAKPIFHRACPEMLLIADREGRTPLENVKHLVEIQGGKSCKEELGQVVRYLDSYMNQPLTVLSSMDEGKTRKRQTEGAGLSAMLNPAFNKFQLFMAGDVYDLLDNLPVHDVASILMAYLTLVDVMKRTSSRLLSLVYRFNVQVSSIW